MLNRAVTNMPKFSSSGRGCFPRPFANSSTTVLFLGIQASMVEGIARHLQDLTCCSTSTATWGSGVPSSTCQICLCAQCWGNTAVLVAPAGQQPLLAGHHVSETEEGLRSRVWQLAVGLGWGSWRGNAAQYPGNGLLQHTEHWNLCAIRPWYSGSGRRGKLCLGAAQLTPLPLPQGCDI